MPVTRIKSQWESGDLVFYDDGGTELLRLDATNEVVKIKGTATSALLAGTIPTVAVADTAAMTATADAPAGGTGATAGAYDTAAHRDAAIAVVNELRADVTALRATVNDLLAKLRTAGIVTP